MRVLLAALLALAVPASSVKIINKEDLLISPDGRFVWKKGEDRIAVLRPKTGKVRRHIRLPIPGDRRVRRKILFAKSGRFFCVVFERLTEIGLHLKTRGGASAAKTTIVSSTLFLLDANGRTRWKKRLRDMHTIMGPTGTHGPAIAEDGTLAILLQDTGTAFAHPQSLILVYDPAGEELLRLDYIDWRRVDQLALSRQGEVLLVRGFGHIEEEEDWGHALAIYRTDSKIRRITAAPRADEAEEPASVDDRGTACCIRRKGRDYTFDLSGKWTAMPRQEE